MSGDSNKAEPNGVSLHEQLTVEAELLDIGAQAPRPGDMYIIALMRYKVLRVVRGRYPYEFILVGHDVPDLSAPAFQVGARHRLQLTKQFPKHASILNKFEDEIRKLGAFYCRAFEILE